MFSIFAFVPHIPTYLINNLDFPRDQYELLYLAGGLVTFCTLQLAGRGVDRYGSLPIMILGTAAATTAVAIGFLFEPPLVPVAVSLGMTWSPSM
jgi:predicted MFS family arabinose efflux permease